MDSIILVIQESGIAIYQNHRHSNNENMRSKLQPPNLKMCLSDWQAKEVRDQLRALVEVN